MEPIRFAPGLVSTDAIEFHPAFSPDGTQIFFARLNKQFKGVILESHLTDGKWSAPAPAWFSGAFDDASPFFSIDGDDLYFMSKRPTAPGRQEKTASVWKMTRRGDNKWTEPELLGFPDNYASGWWTPFLHSDGYFYFGCASLAGDLVKTKYEQGAFSEPQVLGSGVNHPDAVDVEPAISPDGSYMIFYSAGRSDQMGEGLIGDLYVSFRSNSNEWSTPQNMGSPINSTAEENWPVITPDGRYIFFSSNRDSKSGFPDIYWVDAEIVKTLLN